MSTPRSSTLPVRLSPQERCEARSRSSTYPTNTQNAKTSRRAVAEYKPETNPNESFKLLGHDEPDDKAEKLFGSLGLGSFYLLVQYLRGRGSFEKKKVVVSRDTRSASFGALLHVLPVVSSITLIVFNWRGYYIGSELSGPVGEDGLKFLGLQLAAKMLELLCMASLSTIIFALIRHQLLRDGLPFGTITTGFEFSKLSLFWSKEYISTWTANFGTLYTKPLLLTTITVFTILGAVLGPSAAVAALPNLRDWDAGGTFLNLNITFDDLFPIYLNNMNATDVACTSHSQTTCFPSNYQSITEDIFSYWPSPRSEAEDYGYPPVIPENTLLAGRWSLHRIAVRFGGAFVYLPDLTCATTPSSIISDVISQIEKLWAIANTHLCATKKVPSFCYYSDITHAINTLQPLTFVKCNPSIIGTSLSFPQLDQVNKNFPLVEYKNSTIGSQQWFQSITHNGTVAALNWIDLSDDFGHSSIGAVAALPAGNVSSAPAQIFACTIDARWANATAKATFLGGPRVTTGLPQDWFTTGRLKRDSQGSFQWPQVNISSSWASNLDPIIEEQNISVFGILANSVGRLNDISSVMHTPSAVEAILAVMITEGMSRIGSTAAILGSLKENWMKELLPQKGRVFGNGGSAFNYTLSSNEQTTKLQLKTTVNGYGYGTTTATILSTLVLMIYSFIALSYVAYTVGYSRTSSKAWESITELLALGLNSPKSDALVNTGAGISSLHTMNHNIRIEVVDDRVEMKFEPFQDSKSLKDSKKKQNNTVQANAFYG